MFYAKLFKIGQMVLEKKMKNVYNKDDRQLTNCDQKARSSLQLRWAKSGTQTKFLKAKHTGLYQNVKFLLMQW